ncbi:hypothetical protein HNY73_016741 [Argiope bruennichi]|uniref:Uncharacterized protein n=1 Tax=Argiope bruennichi TaxID=94029 RepID=A0A8T0EPR2_ARGBR|nr:hypothetical protein HNY73_016741 [Argiope bruennichi]
MSKSPFELYSNSLPEQNSDFKNFDIRKFEWSIKNEMAQKVQSESTVCESDTEENISNKEIIKKSSFDSCSPSDEEYLEIDEQKDINCDKDNKNGGTLICRFDNKDDLLRKLAGNNRLSTRIKFIETLEIEAVKEDIIKYEKILDPLNCNDDFPDLDHSKGLKDCSDSLTKIQKLGVNPFQIGVLINKNDFLEHCKMVKNGSMKHCAKNSGVPKHIEKEVLEQNSKDLELTVNDGSTIISPEIDIKSERPINEQEKISKKFPSHENLIHRARKLYKDDQESIDISHSKSVSDLIKHFESNCVGNPHRKKRNCSRSITRNRKTNYSAINGNGETETQIQAQHKRDRLENDLLSCSIEKVNDSFAYNMPDRSKQEFPVTSIIRLRNLSNTSIDNHSEFFVVMEVFWFLVVMIIIFWYLVVA